MKRPKWPGFGSPASKRAPLFMASIPHQIEAGWDSDFAPRLAGFPLNLKYTSVRRTGAGNRLVSCCYWFDPGSYCEDGEKRQMLYLPKVKSAYWVSVEYRKKDGFWHTLKYKDEELLCIASGPGFDRAMLQTTLIGLNPDEPIDES